MADALLLDWSNSAEGFRLRRHQYALTFILAILSPSQGWTTSPGPKWVNEKVDGSPFVCVVFSFHVETVCESLLVIQFTTVVKLEGVHNGGAT